MKGLLKALVWCGLGALVGCSDHAGQTGWQVDSRSTGDWLAVSADPAVVAEARRRAAEAEDQEYEAWFRGVRSFPGYIESNTLELLRRRPDETFARLADELDGGPADSTAVNAAIALCCFQHVAGRDRVRLVLQDGSAELKLAVLRGIDHPAGYSDDEEQCHREFLSADPALVTAMLAQFDDGDPQVVKAAIQTCGILELPGANQKLRELLARTDPPDRERILFWLSKGPLDGELLDSALTRRDAWSPDDPGWGTELFGAFARHESEELRKRARNELKRRLAAWRDDGGRGYSGGRLNLVETLGKTSDRRDLSWLREVVDRERGSYATPLATALVRLEGEGGKTRLLEMLHDDDRSSVGIDVAGDVYERSGDEDIVAALAAVGQKTAGRELVAVCHALIGVGSESADSWVRRFTTRLTESDRAGLYLRRDQPPLNQIAQRVAASGILDNRLLDQVVAKIESNPKRDSDYTPNLLDLLGEGGIVAAFDVETGVLPCRHDQLVMEFAGSSRGMFEPQAVQEQWLQQNDDDFEAEYLLTFVYQDRVYRARLRNFGDWYDVERVATVINRALADASRNERFIAPASEGQVALFVFADPAKFARLAEEYGLTLSDDFNSAMDQGQEYERRVLENLDE